MRQLISLVTLALSGVCWGQSIHTISRLEMRLQVPAGARVSEVRIGQLATTEIAADDSTWRIQIQEVAAPRGISGPEAVAQHVLDQLLEQKEHRAKSIPEDRLPRLLLKESGKKIRIKSGEVRAEQFYISTPTASSEGEALIQGRTLIARGLERYAAVSLFATESAFQSTAKRAYENLLSTIEFFDPAEMAAARAAAVEAGLRVMEDFTHDDMLAVLEANTERWERFYRVNQDGVEEEIGYRRIRAREGQRGELDPTLPPSRWQPEDKEKGYVLSIDLRLLAPEEKRVQTAVGSVFFLSTDSERESWKINTIVFEQPRVTAEEIGARQKDAMQIFVDDGWGQPMRISPQLKGKGYLPQVQAYLLGPMLVRAGVEADFGFYCYQSAYQRVQLRRDSVEKTEGGWRITTHLADDAPAQVSVYDKDGNRTRTEYADGSVWEPIDIRDLAKLWERKGLPLKDPETPPARRR